MKHLKKLIFIMAGSVLLFWNCTNTNVETLKGPPTDTISSCDTANMSFQKDVYPVISASCVGCHGNSSGFSLEGYDNVKRNSVKMMKAIEHTSGAPAMPQGAAKLPDCTINKLNAWILQGLKNN